jgi:hypothetical protein
MQRSCAWSSRSTASDAVGSPLLLHRVEESLVLPLRGCASASQETSGKLACSCSVASTDLRRKEETAASVLT